MLKTFFFIPAGNKRFFSALSKYRPDFFVFDLEDSVSSENLNEALEYILQNQFDSLKPIFVRLWNIRADIIPKNISLFSTYKNFILPKVDCQEQLDLFFNCLSEYFQINDFKFVILIESPKGIVNLNAILQKHTEHIYGIGFGSHDYCLKSGMKYDYELLRLPRFLVLNAAKAYEKLSIDIACMEVNNSIIFQKEIGDAMNLGYDAKFIIHPKQLKEIEKYHQHTQEEINEFIEIINEYNKRGKPAIFQFKGRAIELPHIKKYEKIIKNIYGSK